MCPDFNYINGWYNPHRSHSKLGYLAPDEFEEKNLGYISQTKMVNSKAQSGLTINLPKFAVTMAMTTYLAKDYSKRWINQRLKSIEVRKELTDEWEQRGIKQGQEFAILTNPMVGYYLRNY